MLMVGLISAMFPFAAALDFSVCPAGETTTGEVAPLARGVHRLPRGVAVVRKSPDSHGRERTRTTATERAGMPWHSTPDALDNDIADLRLMRIDWQREKRFRTTLQAAIELFPGAGAMPTVKGESLIIDQSQQVMHVYEDSVEIRVIPVSTGLWPMYTRFSGQGRMVRRDDLGLWQLD